jgi:DNA topoisomerase-1
MGRLVHTNADDPGYHRKGRGKGFEYFDKNAKMTDRDTLARIQALRIPPAWKDVWVSKNPDGHLQATGIDARGRKQYLYHPEWTNSRSGNKFSRMAEFAKTLPALRGQLQKDLNKAGWPREKVIALIISILDRHMLRVGNKSYEQENGTYGVTTLRQKHLKSEGGRLVLEFKGKSGVYGNIWIQSKKLARLIRECSELPGHEVFQYLDEEGNRHPVFSQDVNDYLQEHAGADFTAKDFRTWGGTVWSMELFPEALAKIAASPNRKLLPTLVKRVAEKLGNTIAVCKAYYIHPVIFSFAEKINPDFDKLAERSETRYAELKDKLSKHELMALYAIESQ